MTREEPTPASLLAAGAPPRYLLPYLLNLLVNRMAQLTQPLLREHGLTVSRWQVLSILVALDGSRVTTLAELAGATQPVTSRVVDQMERDGLVERRPDPDDQRATGVWLTPRGHEVFHAVVPDASALLDDVTVDLADDEVDALAGLLVRLLARTPDGVGPVDALAGVPFAPSPDDTPTATPPPSPPTDRPQEDPVADIDRSAPVQARAAVTAAASREDVFAVLADLPGWSAVYPELRDLEAEGPAHVGSRFRFRSGPVQVEAEVIALEPGRLLAFDGRGKGASSTYVFRLDDDAEGTSIVAEQSMDGLAAKSMRPMLQKIADTSLQEWADAIARVAADR